MVAGGRRGRVLIIDPMGARTVYAVLNEAVEAYGNRDALHQPAGKGEYKTWTWPEYRDAAREIACGLHGLGVAKGEIVALYSETRAEFYLADLGIMAAGAVSAALYTSYAPREVVKNLRATNASIVFVESPKAMDALETAAGSAKVDVQWILLTGLRDGITTLDELREAGRKAMARDPRLFDRIQSEYGPNDRAILYTTSGATGEPKMALTTHAAIVANLDMTPEKLPLLPADSTIAFLPSAHIAQRIVVELIPIHRGVEVWFSESLAKLPNEMKTIRPTFLLAPPRVWERIYASVAAEIRKRGPLTRKMFHGALGLGAKANDLKQAGKPKIGRAHV